MTFGNLIRNVLKTKAGQKATRAHLLMHRSIEQQYPKGTYDYEISFREEFFNKAMRFIGFNHIQGDYLEFGCCGGDTFAFAYKYKCMNNLEMKLYAFDSFQGLPPPKDIDLHSQWEKGAFKMNQQDFINKLKDDGITKSEYALVPGFYDESLKVNQTGKLGIKQAAIVYVDCDLYESTVPVLNYILPILQTGTIIAFDDYYCFNGDPERGGQLALREFLQRNPKLKMTDYLTIGWSGKAFITKMY